MPARPYGRQALRYDLKNNRRTTMNDVTLLLTPSSAGVPVSHLTPDELRAEAERTENALALAALALTADAAEAAEGMFDDGYEDWAEVKREMAELTADREAADKREQDIEDELADYRKEVQKVADTLRAGLGDLLAEDDISERVRVQVSTLIDDLSEL